MTSVRDAVADLSAVPGVGGLFLASAAAPPRIYRLDHELSAERVEGLVRGLLAVLRRLGSDVTRVELRYEGGRFLLASLRGGVVAAIITDAKPNLPLLHLGIDALRAAASESESDVLKTFRSGEQASSSARAQSAPSAPDHGATPATVVPTGSIRLAPPPRFELARSEPPPAAVSVEPAPDTESRVPALATRASSIPPSHRSSVRPAATGGATHADLARALSAVSLTAARFLGRSVLANYWRQTQSMEGIGEWTVSSDAGIEAVEPDAPALHGARERAERWAAAFVARCALIVADLPAELRATADPDALSLLTRTPRDRARESEVAR